MAATVSVHYHGGSGPTEHEVGAGGLRFKAIDNDAHNVDLTNPIPIPAAGTNYSYLCHVYIKATAGSGFSINNIKFYGDGAVYDANTPVMVGGETPQNPAEYDQATGTAGETGTEMVADHTIITTSVSATTLTSASPKTVTVPTAQAGVIDASGEVSNYVVLQMNVGTAATPGTLANETLTFRYDEV